MLFIGLVRIISLKIKVKPVLTMDPPRSIMAAKGQVVHTHHQLKVDTAIICDSSANFCSK